MTKRVKGKVPGPQSVKTHKPKKATERVAGDPISKSSQPQTRTKRDAQVVYGSASGKPRLRYYIPAVAKHVARVVVTHNMDYEEAVNYLFGQRRGEVNVSEIADNLEKDELVQKFIQEELTVNGLDDTSKESFVKELWTWFRHGAENKSMKAASLLGRAFISEKIETIKPEELPLAGLSAAVRSMLGEVPNDESPQDTSVSESTQS